MKNFTKLFGIIAFVAVIGFLMAACDDGTGGDKSQTVTYAGISGGQIYTLKITKSDARYTALNGDDYELTEGSKKSLGMVQKVAGGVLTLKPLNAAATFTATVLGSSLTSLDGTITWTDDTTSTAPGVFTGGPPQPVDTMKWTTVNVSGIFGDWDIKTVAYGNGTFVISSYYSKKMAYSTDNGATWTEINVKSIIEEDSLDSINVVAYGGGMFVAGSSYGNLAYSMDGVTWIKANYYSGFSYGIESIAWNDGIFVAGGDHGTILYSEDGINWTGGAMGGYISSDIKWTNDEAFGAYSTINTIAYGNGTFVVGGGEDTYMMGEAQMAVTPDGKTWTAIDLSKVFKNNYDIETIAFGKGKFVACDGSGTLATSTDGKKWTVVNSPYGYSFYSIVFGNDIFVAGSSNGDVATSTDGTNWTPVSYSIFGQDEYIGTMGSSTIAYGNGMFIFGGTKGRIAYSKVAGTGNNPQITAYTGTSDGELYMLKITGNSNTPKSGDTYEITSWAKKSTGTVQSVAGGVLTLKPSNATTTFTATISGSSLTALNGTITWTDNTADDAPGTFNGISQSGGNMVWTVANTGTVFDYKNEYFDYTFKTDIKAVAYGNGKFVAGGYRGKMAYSSDNGKTWTAVADSKFGTSDEILSIAYGNGMFIAGGNYDRSARIVYSSDGGVSWTFAKYTDSYDSDVNFYRDYSINAIVYDGSKFVAAGNGSSIYTSTDGKEWKYVSSTNASSIVYANNMFVAGSDKGKIMTSTNGTTWTAVADSKLDDEICSITYGNNKFIAASGSYVAISTNGTTWTKTDVSSIFSTDNGINAIAFGNNKFIAVGYKGKMASSMNGTAWIAENSKFGSDYNTSIKAIAYGNGTFVAVGIDGKITYSSDGSGGGINPGGTAPTITTTSLPDGTVGTAYSQTLAASGDNPITWNIDSGNLPTGLNLTGGVISGTPTTAGASTFTVKATNAKGSGTKSLTITIVAGSSGGTAPTITTTSLPDGTVGTSYSQQLTASGDTPITWTRDSGTLPGGLTLSSAGVISGTPTTAGASTFTVKATNAKGSVTKSLTITIVAGGTAPTITTTTLPNGTVGTAYNQTLAASGDTPITWSRSSGTLPGGLTLSSEGVISGTPTTAGASTFTVKATNAKGSGTKSLTITIVAGSSGGTAPTITTTSLPGGTVGTSYSQQLTASGDTPITWTRDSGTLPGGLTLSSAGVISGTPTTAGTSTFTVKATNTKGSGTKQLSITITASSGGNPTPGGGTFTLTGIPSQYNGMYAYVYGGTVDNSVLVIGAQNIDVNNDTITLSRIANGRVSIPMWKINQDVDSFTGYSGNDTLIVIVYIQTSSELSDDVDDADDADDAEVSLVFLSVSFNKGSATKTWDDADNTELRE